MANLEQKFAAANFKHHIQEYCAEQGWPIADLNDRRAVIIFDMESGRTRTFYIIRYDTTLEFSCPTGIEFESLDDMPDEVSTLLLSQNRTHKIGFWCIEEIEGKQVYSYMHNAEMELMNGAYFASIAMVLTTHCDEMEGTILEMIEEE